MKWKKIGAVLLCACLLAGCGSSAGTETSTAAPEETEEVTQAAEETAAEEEGLYAAGTYSSTVTGRNGEMTVTVTFSANAIESIEVDSVETEAIGVSAMNTLTDEILENQALDVEVISGATVSCEAFLTAVKDTVVQAGADPEALTGAVAQEGEDYVLEADVIVVGAGGAGLSAALTAYESGASVVLLEKSSNVGGNTLCTMAGINAVDSEVQLADEDYVAFGASAEGLKSLQMNNDDVRENLVDAYVANSGEVVDWLASMGVTFTVDLHEDDRNNEDVNPYMLYAGGNFETAPALVNAVYAAIQQTDIHLYLNTPATSLVTDENNTVTGVVAEDADGNEITFSASSVILCTGGFAWNRELVAEVRPDLANAVPNEIAPTTGDGLIMAQAIGAKAVNLDAIQVFPHVMDDYGLTTGNLLPTGYIYVNQDAVRFVAEAFMVNDAVLEQTDSYCIFDADGISNETIQRLIYNGIIKRGETAEELAGRLGIDGEALAATIASYNEDIADGTDDAFGKEEDLDPLEGTLYGYHFGVGAHYFMGGILINEDTQVLDEDENPIEGLYAAGECTGGFHGTFRVDGSGLGDSFVFGRIAGRTAAARAAGE